MDTIGVAAIIGAAVLVGTVLQRISGSGVGLVVAPVLSLIIGPALGVLVTNMTTMVSGFLIMLAVWPRIEWRRYWLVGPLAAVGAVPGAWLVSQLSAGWLSIILGSIVVVALLLTVSLPRLPRWQGRVPGLIAGAVGGFFNTTSGVAAPVMVIYARVSDWGQQGFAATMQPIYMTMGAASVLAKLSMGSVDGATGEVLDLPWLFAGIVAVVILGIFVGGLASRVVSVQAARALALTLAGLGAMGAIIRGILDLTV